MSNYRSARLAGPRRATCLVLLIVTMASGFLWPDARPAQARGLWQVMDREAYMITADTRVVRTQYDLHNGSNLDAVPYRLGDWQGADEPITNQEVFPTLDADHIIHRRYTDVAGRA